MSQQQTRFNLIIAGFGTEALVKQFKDLPSCVNILGSVSKEVYQKLLKTCKAVLIYQHSGTGVLTRIPELMIAGIPIIANSIALRSFHHLKGLYTLHNLKALKNIDSLNLVKPTINAELIKQTQQQQIETITYVASRLAMLKT
jgi:glycosyltransferase involved in cell wall biosynthesis